MLAERSNWRRLGLSLIGVMMLGSSQGALSAESARERTLDEIKE